MKWNQAHIFTLRDAPADAELESHKLLVRGGYIRKLGPGVFTYQNLAVRVLRKLENILRQEFDKRGLTEVIMPMVQPKELWDESGRWAEYGDLLLKMENRNKQWFCLGPTHEEVVTDLIRKDIKSYRDLPRNIYQIQTKYRDEIRPRYGLMRGREFLMKDAYSFDLDRESALKSYWMMYEAYREIFKRTGLDFRIVDADAGNIGGSLTHEFQVLAEAGEDKLLVCDTCDFAANIEVAPSVYVDKKSAEKPAEKPLPKEEFATPGLKQIKTLAVSLKVPEHELVKSLFVKGHEGKPVTVLLRGSDELNLVKLKNVLGLTNPPEMLTDDEVKKLTGAYPGSCGPVSSSSQGGLNTPIYADQFLKNKVNMVVGANKDGFHLKNVNVDTDFKVTMYSDLRVAQAGEPCPNCKKEDKPGKYKEYKGIEVGHVFYLGTKYSKALNCTYLDQAGKSQLIEMGCYGIGVTRSMQAAIEQNHDKNGIIWPVEIAPYHVHICLLDLNHPKLIEKTEHIYRELQSMGFDVLLDDREERPGIKFKDADLIGIPLRINLGSKGFDNNKVDMVIRKSGEKFEVAPDQVVAKVKEWFQQKKEA